MVVIRSATGYTSYMYDTRVRESYSDIAKVVGARVYVVQLNVSIIRER